MTNTSHVTALEGATLLRCSKSKFYRLVKVGQLPPPLKIGRASLWARADVEALLQRGASC